MELKKNILSIITIIALSISNIHAQESSLKEFFGVSFGATAQQIHEQMKAKKTGKFASMDVARIVYDSCIFGMRDNCSIVFFVTNNKLHHGRVNFPSYAIPSLQRNDDGTITIHSRDVLILKDVMKYVADNINDKYPEFNVWLSDLYFDILLDGYKNVAIRYSRDENPYVLYEWEAENGDFIEMSLQYVQYSRDASLWLKLDYYNAKLQAERFSDAKSDF